MCAQSIARKRTTAAAEAATTCFELSVCGTAAPGSHARGVAEAAAVQTATNAEANGTECAAAATGGTARATPTRKAPRRFVSCIEAGPRGGLLRYQFGYFHHRAPQAAARTLQARVPVHNYVSATAVPSAAGSGDSHRGGGVLGGRRSRFVVRL